MTYLTQEVAEGTFIILDETADSDWDSLDHLYCDCDEDTALCGADISECPLAESMAEMRNLCVVCEELNQTLRRCQRCGAEFT